MTIVLIVFTIVLIVMTIVLIVMTIVLIVMTIVLIVFTLIVFVLFDMMRTMPGIEFNKGIPDDIDNADYLDVSQRNFIVLDDHHRNLSIIYIVQNIFHQSKEMRNISLNLIIIISCCSSHQEIKSKFLCLQGK
jgi:hypothetical protein